jgi:hypothetical protein
LKKGRNEFLSRKQKFNHWNTHIHDDLDFDPTRKLNAHHLIDEANMADAATSCKCRRKRRLTDSALKRKKKETNALIKDLRRRRVRSLERFKDSPEVENSHSGILFTPIDAPRTRVI